MASESFVVPVRDKQPFIQDAFVRDVNKTEVATSGDPVAVDTSALETRLLADARKVVGTTKIASIAIMQVQIAPLHPVPITPGAVPAPQQNESAVAAKPVKAP